MLLGRLFSYHDTHLHRIGTNYEQLPVNRDAEGTPLGSGLTKGKWLWGDGSLAAIARTITQGVAKPKEHTGVMPPMARAQRFPSKPRHSPRISRR
jgi:catalase